VAEVIEEYLSSKNSGSPAAAKIPSTVKTPATAKLSAVVRPPDTATTAGQAASPGDPYAGKISREAALKIPAGRQAVPAAGILSPPDVKPKEEGMAAGAERQEWAVRNPELLKRMQNATSARIGVGRAGPRLRTGTLLKLRADHAAARDAVFRDVSAELLESLGIPAVESRCANRQEHITRPDLGRRLSAGALKNAGEYFEKGKDVQIIVSDGLSSRAIEANLANLYLVLADGLKAKNISTGKPVFVRFGRVAIEDEIAEITGAKLVCILIGERPGLATAESMSAYLCYEAKMGQSESRRTVVSNIHANGIPAAEAGAYLVDLIEKILEKKASGVDFKR
jgi:ethanolamine ammonia-lyase small subunit